MKTIHLAILCLISANLFGQNIALKDATSKAFEQKEAENMVPAADGEHYFQANAKNDAIFKYAYKTGLIVDTIFSTTKARECTFNTFEGFVMSPDEKRLLVYNNKEEIYRRSFKANYFYYDMRRNHVRKLTENKSKQMAPVFSEDGRMLAYVVDNNIWLSKFDYETESQITTDGAFGKLINGASDWVYEEEFRVTSLINFSPNGKLLAFVSFDEEAVKEFSFQRFEGKLYPELSSFKYPKAGEKNSTVLCKVFDVESKTIRTMNIPPENTEYIPRIDFVNDSELAIMTLNRNQNIFNMYFVNPKSAVARLILNEQNEKYIDSDLLNSITFLDNQFLYLSEKNGYSHIYLFSNTGVEQKQLTSGNFDVKKILAVDAEKKAVFYQSAEESPLKRTISKVDLLKGVKTKLSEKSGFNVAQFGKNGRYFINTWSDASTVGTIAIHDANGKQVRVIEDNHELKEKLAKVQLAKKEFITVNTKDGIALNAWILKPLNFDANKKYPLVMVQYSGPNSQQVLDQFSISWVDHLVTQGFIVACVDGRGTGARGEEFRKSTYMNLGIKESDDQIDAAKHFGSLPYIDKNRIAIWGWSYGGYNTLMSMSRSNVFKAGIAIAPVTDWRFYDTVYGERFMRTPQQNKSGYEAGSPIALANKLEGNLLLIHGSADDNVHFQNSMEYADALIKADKQFEMFVFPDRNHSILGDHDRNYLFSKLLVFLKKNL